MYNDQAFSHMGRKKEVVIPGQCEDIQDEHETADQLENDGRLTEPEQLDLIMMI